MRNQKPALQNGKFPVASSAGVSKKDLPARTRAFALRIIRLYQAIPKTGEGKLMSWQILKSGTSVGAHVAESCHPKSRADFTSKIDGAMQELEETLFWLDMLVDAGAVKATRLKALKDESHELMAIFVSMVKKTRSK
jgi:four helix bundle protein